MLELRESIASSAPGIGSLACASSTSSLRKKERYALTKPDGLNFGKQMGIQEEDAGELAIEGEWTVFNRMWMSRHIVSRDLFEMDRTNLQDVSNAFSV